MSFAGSVAQIWKALSAHRKNEFEIRAEFHDALKAAVENFTAPWFDPDSPKCMEFEGVASVTVTMFDSDWGDPKKYDGAACVYVSGSDVAAAARELSQFLISRGYDVKALRYADGKRLVVRESNGKA